MPGEDGGEYPDEHRNGCDTAHRDGVRQVHGRFINGTNVAGCARCRH
jgi:hypothetical protein